MRKIRLSAGSKKGIGSVLAALAVAAAVTSALYPWTVTGSTRDTVWSTWDGWLERPVGELLSLGMAPLALLVAGFALLLTGLAGKARHLTIAAGALLAAAPLYYLAVVLPARVDVSLELGFWLVLVAGALALAASRAAPARG